MVKVKQIVLASISVYMVWVIATYMLEGRILTLLRPEAVFEHIAYTFVANFLIGTVVAVWVVRSFLKSGIVTLKQSGFSSIHLLGSYRCQVRGNDQNKRQSYIDAYWNSRQTSCSVSIISLTARLLTRLARFYS
jgi:hypothetical protein